MNIRCGIDIVYIPALKHKFRDEAVLKKFFHAKELANPKLEHLAGVIAAKEAFFKVLGVIPQFLDVQVVYEAGGRPKLIVAPQWQNFKECDVSISHDNDYAVAVAVLESNF
jgi:phosphopantetheine--protein transferase-like protein